MNRADRVKVAAIQGAAGNTATPEDVLELCAIIRDLNHQLADTRSQAERLATAVMTHYRQACRDPLGANNQQMWTAAGITTPPQAE